MQQKMSGVYRKVGSTLMSMGKKLLLFLTLIFKIIGIAKFNFDSMGLCTMIQSTFDSLTMWC